MRRRRIVIGLGVAALLGAATLGVFAYLRAPHPGLVARGREVYERVGCVGCHGPGGLGGVANPRSEDREVPGFAGGTAMMYVESEAEIREWILDGFPARLKSEREHKREALLGMPAFRNRLSDADLEALVAYYKAVAWYTPRMPAAAVEGRRVANRFGCFGCHGPSGLAGVPNPDSFKGYVPGWGSPDYFELVEDDAELRAWILDGSAPRFGDDPLARRFLDRQVLGMPAYRGVLSEAELEAVVAYVGYVASDGPR